MNMSLEQNVSMYLSCYCYFMYFAARVAFIFIRTMLVSYRET